MASPLAAQRAPVALHPIARAYAYREVAAACAAAFSAHYSIDLAEGALVDCNDVRAESHVVDAILEGRRFLAHLGFAVVPLDEAPADMRADTLRLIGGGPHG
jgi:hypothetical protein